jgi:single-strand DNA-binding protein
MDNAVILVGNLTDDPELRFTPQGDPVASFRLAQTSRVPDGAGGWKDGATSFFRITVWRGQAENVAESLAKGARAVVVGRLRQRTWETEDGDKRSLVEVDADEVAASLKFHTAKLTRATTAANGGGNGARRAATAEEAPPF